MDNIPTKSTGDLFTAVEYNPSQDELENSVTDSGQALGGDRFQLSRGMAINASGADYYDDSGVADAYVLSKPGTSSLRSPPAYFEGMRIRFRPTNNNTGASTVNVTGVGAVSILKEDGASALSSGDLTTARDAECRYDITAGAFLLKKGAPEATQASKGIVFLRDQRVLTSNNVVDPVNDIDFSGGRFTFDDGTGEAVAPAYTKQLDAVFVGGNNQGGLDTGAISDNTYHCFAIYNPTNGIADYLFSLSPTTPTLPAGYTKKRLVWTIVRASGAIRIYTQAGNRCYLQTEVQSFNGNVVNVEQTQPIDVPSGLDFLALVNAKFRITGPGVVLAYLRLYPPSGNNDVVTLTNGQVASESENLGGGWRVNSTSAFEVLTDTNRQIKLKSSTTLASVTNVGLRGWIHLHLEQ